MNDLIKGNKTIKLYKKEDGEEENEIGENILTNTLLYTIIGYLDYINGEVGKTNYIAPINESTHIFIADYQEITETTDNLTAKIDGKEYEVKYIDDPMELHEQLEIYLKLLGG